MTLWNLGFPPCALLRISSDCADAQADVSLRWLHMHSFKSSIITMNLLPDTEAKFLVQLLKYLPGVSMFEAGTPFELLPSVGRLVGKMDRVLKVRVYLPVFFFFFFLLLLLFFYYTQTRKNI